MILKFLQRGFWLLLISSLLLTGCGRKEAPQMAADGTKKPQLTNLQHEVVGGVLNLTFKIDGDEKGVGYQIDRTQIDPYCQCPGFWRRYFEQPAFERQVGTEMTKIINLKTTKIEYVYRLRAIDTAGNLGAWSKMIRARGVDLFNK